MSSTPQEDETPLPTTRPTGGGGVVTRSQTAAETAAAATAAAAGAMTAIAERRREEEEVAQRLRQAHEALRQAMEDAERTNVLPEDPRLASLPTLVEGTKIPESEPEPGVEPGVQPDDDDEESDDGSPRPPPTPDESGKEYVTVDNFEKLLARMTTALERNIQGQRQRRGQEPHLKRQVNDPTARA